MDNIAKKSVRVKKKEEKSCVKRMLEVKWTKRKL